MKRYIKSATNSSGDLEIDENGVLVKYHGNAANVVIPDSVTEIGGEAFSGCTSLTNITIPDSVTEIGYGAFMGCTSLKSITIPDGVAEIGRSAFNGCTSLTKVSLPNNVKLGEYVFLGTPLESKFNQD